MITLALLQSRHRDELEADFQQFYGLDYSRMGADYSVAHAAVLANQMPRESRVFRALNPDLEWSDEMSVLVRIDYLLQVLLQALTGNKSGFRPTPIQTPSERVHIQEQLNAAEADMDEVARILGIGG